MISGTNAKMGVVLQIKEGHIYLLFSLFICLLKNSFSIISCLVFCAREHNLFFNAIFNENSFHLDIGCISIPLEFMIERKLILHNAGFYLCHGKAYFLHEIPVFLFACFLKSHHSITLLHE